MPVRIAGMVLENQHQGPRATALCHPVHRLRVDLFSILIREVRSCEGQGVSAEETKATLRVGRVEATAEHKVEKTQRESGKRNLRDDNLALHVDLREVPGRSRARIDHLSLHALGSRESGVDHVEGGEVDLLAVGVDEELPVVRIPDGDVDRILRHIAESDLAESLRDVLLGAMAMAGSRAPMGRGADFFDIAEDRLRVGQGRAQGGLGEPGQLLACGATKLPVRPQRACNPPERSRSRFRSVGHPEPRRATLRRGARRMLALLRELAGAGPDIKISLQRPIVGVCRHTLALRVRRGPLRTRGLGISGIVGSARLGL